MPIRRGFKGRFLGVLVVLGLVAGGVAAGAAEPKAAGLGTVRAVVKYLDGGGVRQPLPGVEVYVWDGSAAHYACTNASGVAVFKDLPPGSGFISATGVSINEPRCPNDLFLNPDNGKKMFAVFWQGHSGVRQFDNFSVAADQVTRLLFVVRTARGQARICGGLRATWIGTAGPDVHSGTIGDDVISGRGGADILSGGPGNDFICGMTGPDQLSGGRGDDFLFGEGGRDVLVGGMHHDILLGGPLKDACDGETMFDCEL